MASALPPRRTVRFGQISFQTQWSLCFSALVFEVWTNQPPLSRQYCDASLLRKEGKKPGSMLNHPCTSKNRWGGSVQRPCRIFPSQKRCKNRWSFSYKTAILYGRSKPLEYMHGTIPCGRNWCETHSKQYRRLKRQPKMHTQKGLHEAACFPCCPGEGRESLPKTITHQK